MHLRNSWMRSMSSCCMRHVPPSGLGLGANAGIFFAILKFDETSVTRSLMIGNDFIGVTVMGSPSGSDVMRVMHISFGLPLISALHEPHRPALQFHRTASEGSCLALRLSACT